MNNKKRILVRVDGSKNIGLGHVYNMITVLEHLKNNEILIVMKKNKRLGITKLKKFQFKIQLFSTKMELEKIIEKFQPNLIFNDLLNTNVTYMKFLKKFNSTIVNFEDLGPGRKYADLVFNPIYYNDNPAKNEFYGHKYACVRTEFRKSKNVNIRKNVKKIVVTFGGTDPTNKTQNVIKFIEKFQFKEIQWNIILGLGFSHRRKIKSSVNRMNKCGYKIYIIEKSDNISKFIKNCDFAITSNGRTVFELAAMKIPMIAVAVNNRERQHSFVRYTKTGFHIDSPGELQISKLTPYIKKIMKQENRIKFSNNLKKADVLDGIEHVTKKINAHLK